MDGMSLTSALRTLFSRSRAKTRSAEMKIKDSAYAQRFGMSVADWIIYHHEKIHFKKMHWMGVRILKNPMDCWIYQELLWEVRPDLLVELGSLAGGSTLFFCHLFDLFGRGEVLSIDIDRSRFQVQHPRLSSITGDCSDGEIVSQVAACCPGKRVMVVHDAEHSRQAVLRDLHLYADFVSVGSYFIVEDGIVDLFGGRASKRMRWNDQPGPLAAVRDFVRDDQRFVIDHDRERYLITANPCGFLKRVK